MDSPSKKIKFLLRVEGDILSTLRDMAKARQISLSQLLRDILREYVERGERLEVDEPVTRPSASFGQRWWEQTNNEGEA
jgi:hypothetical protein|tara:strand:+ start:891 stop:1127 length:237 start_codon:yes stop_codon:yes gene_type:complete